MEFKYRLEWELLELVKKEKVTPSQYDAGPITSPDSVPLR